MAGNGQVIVARSEVGARIRVSSPIRRPILSTQARSTRKAGRVALLAESSLMVSRLNPRQRSKHAWLSWTPKLGKQSGVYTSWIRSGSQRRVPMKA